MSGAIITALAPLVGWLIGLFIKDQAVKEQFKKSFFAYLNYENRKAKGEVEQYIDAEKALKALQDEIEGKNKPV